MSPEKEIAKLAFAEAEKEAKEKQVAEVKRIVVKTLEKLDAVKKDIKVLQEKERILKMDIDDLKEGRLDLIAERQEKDPEAKKVSVVLIIKEKEIIREKEYVPVPSPSPWYFPYQVVWQVPYTPTYTSPTILCQSTTTGMTAGGSVGIAYSSTSSNCTLSDGSSFQASVEPMVINGSVSKYATTGSYEVNGHIINLR
jgi:hypothetical protein